MARYVTANVCLVFLMQDSSVDFRIIPNSSQPHTLLYLEAGAKLRLPSDTCPPLLPFPHGVGYGIIKLPPLCCVPFLWHAAFLAFLPPFLAGPREGDRLRPCPQAALGRPEITRSTHLPTFPLRVAVWRGGTEGSSLCFSLSTFKASLELGGGKGEQTEGGELGWW